LAVRNLPDLRTNTSLNNMSPVSLLFSSDQETSRRLSQVLQELELEVQHCPEIFAAVQRLTSRSFDVVVADWDEGLEAAFLLKTSRELKSNSGAFTIAIASSEASAAARQVGANLVLSKPLVPDKAKYALLTCDEFLCHMKTWLPKLAFPDPDGTPTRVLESKSWPAPDREKRSGESLPARPAQPSPAMRGAPLKGYMPVIHPAWIFEDDLFPGSGTRGSGTQTIFEPDQPRRESSETKPRKGHLTLLHKVALGVAFLSYAYVFSEPLRSEAVATSVAKIWGSALEKAQVWLRDSDDHKTPAPEVMAGNASVSPARTGMDSKNIRVTPVLHSSPPREARPTIAQPRSLQAGTNPQHEQIQATTTGTRIPESLQTPISGGTVRSVAAKLTPSLLAALEPVALPEDLSAKLLLQKVQPSYPKQALRAGLQGPVVLQAWIGRDGTIREVKLIRGSLLLGQAAYKAVKQWRFQPYLLNGRAVEAQTYVTIDFRLPLISRQ
jgi:TonB family protein